MAAYVSLPGTATPLAIPSRLPSIRTSIRKARGRGADKSTEEGESDDFTLSDESLDDDYPYDQLGNHAFLCRSCLAVLATVMVLAGTAAFVYATRFQPERPAGTQLVFFAIGDWGKTGSRHQQEVATLMGAAGSYLAPDFILSTGDNLYPAGMSSSSDPAFQATFSAVYTAPSLQVPWHAVLGNHDYGQGSEDLPGLSGCPQADNLAGCSPGCCYSPSWQTSNFSRSLDTRWHCQQGARQLLLLNGTLQLVLVDTSPFVPMYRTQPWAHVPGGIAAQDAARQQAAVRGLLSEAGPRVRMVVGHHSIRSYGKKCAVRRECLEFTWLASLMQASGVTLYMNGHDHLLQHVKLPNETTHYVTSGGGAEFHRQDFNDWAPERPFADYLAYEHGFAAVFVGRERVVVRLYGLSKGLRPVHEFTVPLAA